MTRSDDIPAILDQLTAIYESSCSNLRRALAAYVERGERPDPDARSNGCFAYPELRISYDAGAPRPSLSRAFARLTQPGVYASSIARPTLFRRYLENQLTISFG